MEKICSFFGHRKIDATDELKRKVDIQIELLIKEKGVVTFLFGSRSQFDDLCHERVTKMQEKYSDIKRIAFTCKSEYACMKDEKEELERIARAVTKRDIKYKDYDGVMESERVNKAGKASYVERNQEMINVSDYCVFYYDPQYQPPKRKIYKHGIFEEQPKSGTMLAYEYAHSRKRAGCPIEIINLWESFDEETE